MKNNENGLKSLLEENKTLSLRLGKLSLLEHFWSHTEDNIFVVRLDENGDFIIEDVNPAPIKFINLPNKEIINHKVSDLFDKEIAKELQGKYLNCIRVNRPVSYYEGFPLNGSFIYFNTLLIPIVDEKENITRIFGLSREMTQLVSAKQELENLNRQLEQTVSNRTQELKNTNEQLKKQAFTDQLTGIGNRRHFFESVEQLLQNIDSELNSSLLYLDLDYFKSINDKYGHTIGDEILIQFSRHLKRSIRESDILCRMGGEEFVIFVPLTDKNGALELARKILRSVESTPFIIENQVINITTSIGVASMSSSLDCIEKLIFNADKALYHAKRNGRNRVEQF